MDSDSNHHHAPHRDGSERSEIGALEKELARQKGLYARVAADFHDFRKRTAREADRRATAEKEAFILELLPAVDSLERALAARESASYEQLLHGVDLTLQQLRQLLHRHGIESDEDRGKVFNPHRHEAIRTGYDPTRPDHIVLELFQKGYRRGQEVFRPAKVEVNDLSQPAPPATHAD